MFGFFKREKPLDKAAKILAITPPRELIRPHVITKDIKRFEAVSEKTGMPPKYVLALAQRYTGFDFRRTIRNGDPLPWGLQWEIDAIESLKNIKPIGGVWTDETFIATFKFDEGLASCLKSV